MFKFEKIKFLIKVEFYKGLPRIVFNNNTYLGITYKLLIYVKQVSSNLEYFDFIWE